ncbi:MAG TPA: DUF2306 domain-containing protein [Mucilaginibacter sp.]|nr:DUF2306 domain-containing protein [Mucilaginibacter sp.]
MKLKYLLWIVFGFFALSIGFYPVIYYLVDMHGKGLFASKTPELLANQVWHTAFYIHITFGGIAMLTGWTQFSPRIRNNYTSIHRTLGKIYVFAVMLSSLAGFYIAMFASGGIISVLGFGMLAASWFFTVTKAYSLILKKQFKEHENWMIRNYALTFAAFTLRIYLPLSTQLMHWDFTTSYRIISWACWVPNLVIAQIIINKRALIPAYVVKKKQVKPQLQD